MRIIKSILPIILATIFTFTLITSVAQASSPNATTTVFTVNNATDADDATPGDGACDIGDGTCTLRAAISEANAWAGDDIIELAAGITHTLALAGRNEDGNAVGDLDITGNGAVIDANQLDRVLHVLSGADVTVNRHYTD